MKRGVSVKMARFPLSALVALGLFTLINGQCRVDFQNGTISNNGSSCAPFSEATLNNTLFCSGIQLSDSSQGNLKNLKAFTDAAFDLYTLLRSKLDVSQVVKNINQVRTNGSIVGSLSDVNFARLWFQVKLNPYLSSLSKDTLSCLSQSSLTCQSFQALVKDLSSQIGPERQRMVYQNFVKPFLARNTSDAGCVNSTNTTEEWLPLNFQTFSASASLGDFSALNPKFDGLLVLDQLTPEQKAELMFQLEASAKLNINAITKIFGNLLKPLFNTTLNVTSASSNGPDKNLSDFLVSLRPFGRFIRSCVNIAQTTSVSSIRNETILLLVNWAMNYDSRISNNFSISNFSDWSQFVVAPVMKKFLQINQSLPSDFTAITNFLFAAEPQITEPVDNCKFTSSNSFCQTSQTEENLAKSINCVAQSNLIFTEENQKLLITELSRTLQTLTSKLMTNSSQNITALFAELPAESFTSGNLDDVDFMRFWFQIKMKPLLPQIPREFLSCFNTRGFSCQAYRTLYVELNNNSGLMDSATQMSVLKDFIFPFLSKRQSTGVDCTLPFTNSVDFILQNFGSFSPLVQLQDFSNVSRNFSAVDALPVLTMGQLVELVFNPPAKPEDRRDILTRVFDFLLQAPNRDKLNNFLPSLQTQARKANFSCDNYKVIFERIDQALSSIAPNQSEALLTIRDSVMMIPPDNCIEKASTCITTPVDEAALCAGVDSAALNQILNRTPQNATGLCNFTVLQFACQPVLSQLSSQQVADLLACKLSSNVTKDTWKLFFTKIGTNLDDALLKIFNNTPSASNVSLSNVLDVIADVRINRLSPQRLRDPAFIQSWFQGRLNPFLPSLSQSLLSCLSTKNLTCETYRTITTTFVNAPLRDGQDICNPLQPTQRQDLIYTNFMKAFLSRSDINDLGCLNNTANSTQWVNRNFGPFVQSATLKDLEALNRNFSAMEVLPQLSLRQLFELSVSTRVVNDPQSIISVMQQVKDCQLPVFFDLFSPNVQNISLTQDVKAALIKQIFERANLSNLNITNQEVDVWIQKRLNPLLTNLSESLVSPFFTILNKRDCNITQSTLGLLDAVRPSLPNNTKNAIYNSILQSFIGPQPLRCYRNNSFIKFLNESLYGFGPLPNLNIFLSLIPPTRRSELVNSIAPSELGSYLRQPEVVNNGSQICVIFNNFTRTPEFLDTEEVPDDVKSNILPCVWPLALTSDNETEIDLWFNRRLKLYLKFLNKDTIRSKDTLSASCQSYKKMVSVLGSNFTFNGSQITTEDVYATIKTYLTADTQAKCYNSSDARLNSTAWFVNHIGVFITLLTLDDLYSFGPESTMKIFAVNPENIKLFNQKALPKNVISRYTELIFLQNSNFNLFDLPSFLQCDAPVSTFTKLNENQTNVILGNFKTSCSNVDPAISAALTGNIKTIDASTITSLGSQIVGITATQINLAPPSVLISSLSTLGNTSGWSLGQAKAIIGVLLIGDFKINTPSSLLSLGSLIGGIPSTVLTILSPTVILETSRNTEFVKNIVAAPEIVQRTFVSQLIKVGSTASVLMANIPSDLAIQIPRKFLEITGSVDPTVLIEFNKKKWKPEQAVLFFDSVAGAFNQSDDLSVEVLQGFTCSRVQTMTQTKVKGLIRACRSRPSRSKVILSETQLTCMYNIIRKESVSDFENYHPDMLLYFNYETINKTFCKSYFTQVGAADLSVFSSTLSGRRDILLNNAIDCLGINRTSIKKEDLPVLGNLVCAVSSDVIINSDPEILENLKNCKDLSDSQILAMQGLLMKGTSKYGPTSNWNQKTLNDLGILPLYFSQSFWQSFRESDLAKFFKTFFKFVRGQNTPKPQLKKLFKAIIVTSFRAKRAAECTKGSITSLTISDDAFPFGYDEAQFGLCLSSTVVKDNLASLCEKIEDSAFQRIILDKLKEIQPNGLSEDQVQVLKSVSRNASVDEISKWNITKLDTLAALMNANDGEWSSAQSKLIITKYLNANNNLTATELNVVKGPNLCSLNASVLSTILPENMRESDALDVSKCSSENKKALFTIANQAFPMSNATSQRILSAFQLIETYLGGADLSYIRNLSSYNVSMSLSTFITLDPSVVSSLSIADVVGLLGNNLQDLKTFENQTVVRSWISLQLQSELNKLNLTLTGGRAEDTTTTATTTTTTTVTTKATTAKTTAGTPGIGPSGLTVSFSILILYLIYHYQSGDYVAAPTPN
uniref:Mesothelin a n=1 Tax=Cyprinus carpio TaxID=7962 RepID=A0A8C1ZK03_CYPCA